MKVKILRVESRRILKVAETDIVPWDSVGRENLRVFRRLHHCDTPAVVALNVAMSAPGCGGPFTYALPTRSR